MSTPAPAATPAAATAAPVYSAPIAYGSYYPSVYGQGYPYGVAAYPRAGVVTAPAAAPAAAAAPAPISTYSSVYPYSTLPYSVGTAPYTVGSGPIVFSSNAAATVVAAAPATLYYWKIKARNYLAVVVAKAGGIKLEEKFDTDGSLLKTMKENGTLPFGQFPYLEDGAVKMGQSLAIANYLAQKGGLLGFGADFAKSDMLVQEFEDIYSALIKAQYAGEGKAEAYNKFLSEYLPKQLGYLEKLLRADGKQFTSGAKFLVGDYAIAVALDLCVGVKADALASSPKLQAFYQAALALPAFDGVKNYDNYFKL
jgi:glutathione S-transferase